MNEVENAEDKWPEEASVEMGVVANLLELRRICSTAPGCSGLSFWEDYEKICRKCHLILRSYMRVARLLNSFWKSAKTCMSTLQTKDIISKANHDGYKKVMVGKSLE